MVLPGNPLIALFTTLIDINIVNPLHDTAGDTVLNFPNIFDLQSIFVVPNVYYIWLECVSYNPMYAVWYLHCDVIVAPATANYQSVGTVS